jgi:hypothetical protein
MLRPLPGGRPAIRPVDHIIPYEIYYAPAINEAVRTGRLSEALALYRTALRVEPSIVRRLGPARPAESESERGLADVFAEIYRRYADTLAEAGKPRRAAAMARRAAALEAAITLPPSASGAQPGIDLAPRQR